MSDLFSHGWLGHCLALFALTFLHEDAAIVAAAFSHAEFGLPPGLALLSVYTGTLAGDLSIYGLGRAAQRSAWLRKRFIGDHIAQLKTWLETHLARMVVLCRVTPGLLFPTFVACGWFRLPFRRFALWSLLSVTVYTPLAMALASLLGTTLWQHLGHWAWGLVLLLALALTLRGARGPQWRLSGAGRPQARPDILEVLRNNWPGREHEHRGMPSLTRLLRRIAPAERIPTGVFYLPIAVHWLRLALRYRSLTLPTVADPMIEIGGFWGESKSACLDSVGPEHQCWVAPYVTLDRGTDAAADDRLARSRLDTAGLGLPVVVKPDIGWQGYGVALLGDAEALSNYIAAFPPGQRLILQRPIPHDGEAGVLYARLPGEPTGRVLSLTLRYFPFVTGDGHATLRALILRDPRAAWKARQHLGSHPEHMGLSQEDLERVPAIGELVRLAFIGSIRVGGLYRDASHLITPQLSARFDAISRSMPEFYFGRYDIRFESLEDLQAGTGFAIIEVNGAGAEAIQAWDPELPLRTVYRQMFEVQSLLFEIAARNRARGFRPIGARAFIGAFMRQHRLLKQYPPSG